MQVSSGILKISGLVIAGFSALFLAASPAEAYNRIFPLHLKNGANNDPVTFRVSNSGHRCYEGNVPIGRQVGGAVPAGGHVTITVARVQGHGCDGENGVFSIELSNHPGVAVSFMYSNDGGMWMPDPNSAAFGELSAKSPNDESYTWETNLRQAVTAGRATGSWIKVCQGFCNKVFKTEITNTTTNTTETSSEVRQAISATLSGGVDLGAFSAGGSVTASTESAVGQRMSQELATSSLSGTDTTIQLSLEQMEERGLFSVWQWIATTRMSNGNDIVVTTVQYTCTPDARSPRYLPGSDEDIQSCRKRGTPVAVAPQPAPAPAATNVRSWNQIVPSSGAETDVTDFVLYNDSDMMWSVSWIDSSGNVTQTSDVTPPGESWVVANGAKTWESHWYAISTENGFLCSISLRQGARVNFSQLTACQ